MDIRPILAALHQHKIPASLIVLEIALACAVFCNAVFMIGHRVAELHMPDGVDQAGLLDISVRGTNPEFANADIPRDLAMLRRIPGVIGAAATSAVPFGKGQGIDSVSAKVDAKNAPGSARYMFTRGGAEVLGLRLLRGRLFNDDEYAAGGLAKSFPTSPVVIVTQSLAQRLWPTTDPLGKLMWMGHHDYTVIGVVANVAQPGPSSGDAYYAYYSTFFPTGPNRTLTDYMIGTAPADRADVLHTAVTKLQELSPNAVIEGHTFEQIRNKAFATTRSMVGMLVLVCVVMLAVTGFAVMGLTGFWVGQRRRTIGIRRALGATRGNIVQYFQTENFLLSTAGIVLGVLLAYGANLYLMAHYQIDHMPWYYLLVSAIALWILGQFAVLRPALRAAHVPPVVATRNV